MFVACRVDEPECARCVGDNVPAALVHRLVVKMAERHQIVELCRATICPMNYVMCMKPSGRIAAGKPAHAVVASCHGPSDPSRHETLRRDEEHEQRVPVPGVNRFPLSSARTFMSTRDSLH